jgi:16S rRNA processing protein RimM
MENPLEKLVKVGVIIGAHGIRGEVKIRPLLENVELLEKAPLLNEKGKELFSVKITGELKDAVIAKINNITDRNSAELLKNTELFAPSSILPPAEDGEFYHSELIGLEARNESGKKIGTINNILNFGAGDILEITLLNGEELLLPFSEPWVLEINPKAGFISISPVDYLEANSD